MGINAALLGKDRLTGAERNILSSEQALHVTDRNSLGIIGNLNHGPTDRQLVQVFGRNLVVNNTLEDAWDGPTSLYVFPTTPIQMRVVSSSVNDTLAGTGTQKLEIHYLDTDYLEQTEIVNMNGTTPVNTVATNILRINRVHTKQIGTNGTPVGNISVTNTAGTVTYGYLTAGLNIARQAIYTVPAGKTLYVTKWQASSGSTGNHFCQTVLRATSEYGVRLPGVFLVQDEVGTQNGAIEIDYAIPLVMPEKTDIRISNVSDAVNANVIALGAFFGYVETMV